jgi:hypothetical protein
MFHGSHYFHGNLPRSRPMILPRTTRHAAIAGDGAPAPRRPVPDPHPSAGPFPGRQLRLCLAPGPHPTHGRREPSYHPHGSATQWRMITFMGRVKHRRRPGG